MKKVKVTKEQAEEIEFAQGYHLEEYVIKAHTGATTWELVGKFKGLNKLVLDKLIRALYIGYEVEPDFKVGDWVYHKPTKSIGKVDAVGDTKISVITYDDFIYFGISEIRHATPEEISAEKERRTNEKLDDIMEDLNGFERIKLLKKLADYAGLDVNVNE